jgi:site-specific DNA-cytosine methylase
VNVLSLFDGMSCGQIALERAGIKVDKYYASEINPYSIKITQKNYPDTIQLGDVTKINTKQLPKIDMLIGGSPCQNLSITAIDREEVASGLEELNLNYFMSM